MQTNIGQLAKKAGVSIRLLRYYDEIGLLSPVAETEAGYRLYDEESLSRLQQILFFRELGFPLAEIRRMLSHPNYDPAQALSRRRALLCAQRERVDALIRLVDETLEGEKNMSKKTKPNEYEQLKSQYAAEAKERWGSTEAYKISESRAAARSGAQEAAIAGEADEIFAAFAAQRGKLASDAAVQQLVERWQAHITKHYYPCSKEILAGLGEMYVADARFTENLDRFGEGTAQLMHDAIACYCAK